MRNFLRHGIVLWSMLKPIPVVAQLVEKHTNALSLKTLYPITVGTTPTLRNRTDMNAQKQSDTETSKGGRLLLPTVARALPPPSPRARRALG